MVQDLHAEPAMGDLAHPAADPAESDDPQGLAGDLAARHAGADVVVARDQPGRHPRKVPRQADHERKDMLGDALRVGAGGVHDLDAAGRRGVDVDLIVADAMPAHDPELLAAIEERGIDDAAGADDEAFGSDDLALQRRRIECAGHAQLGRFPEDARAPIRACSSTTG